jgi:hypothetical protein
VSHCELQRGCGFAYVHVLNLRLLSELHHLGMRGVRSYRHSSVPQLIELLGGHSHGDTEWQSVDVLICRLRSHQGLARLLLLV